MVDHKKKLPKPVSDARKSMGQHDGDSPMIEAIKDAEAEIGGTDTERRLGKGLGDLLKEQESAPARSTGLDKLLDDTPEDDKPNVGKGPKGPQEGP